MRHLKSYLLSVVALIASACGNAVVQEASFYVVPRPESIRIVADGKGFVLNGSTRIVAPADSLRREALFMQQYVDELTGHKLKITSDRSRNAVTLISTLQSANPEAYIIYVSADSGIVVNGASSAGVFYGVQTLRKAIPNRLIPSDVRFPEAVVADQPRFAYRGAHLDVSRHPMEADSVKAYIDMLALHNINRFHWHLSDDQGWRIEIKRYPRLTQVGSHRDGTMVGRDWSNFDTISVDGFYTQEEARDIVRYAAERHITVIPEIDLPGHMQAALAAYPSLGCTGGPYEVWKQWGVSFDVLCAGNDSVYDFIDGVLTEIADIFPSEIIHIGGDECPKVRWKECPKCQARIRELGLVDDAHSSAESKLQSHVMALAEETLARRGRRIIGWDEILEGGVTPGAMIMSWRGVEGGLTAARSGHDAVLTPVQYCYFNYCQSDDPSTEPLGFTQYLPLEKVYSFDPIPADLSPDEASHIIGVQANLWREYIATLSHSQYMALPRLAAISEVQWCAPENRDYDAFLLRMPSLLRHYEVAGFNYRPLDPRP